MPARLSLYLPQQAVVVQTLREGTEYVVGRDEECAILVDDDRISRRHALICHRGTWSVTDLESKNGTLVDGHKIETAPLTDRSWLSLGGVLARFETLTEAQESAAREEQISRWRSSVELRRRLSPAMGLEVLLQAVLDSVLQLAGTRRGFVLLERVDGELEVCAARNLDADDLLGQGFGGSLGAVTRALKLRQPVALGDAVADTELGRRDSVLSGGIRALVCLPLNALGRLLGAVYSDSDEPGKELTHLDVEILEALADHAALAISVARLDHELEELAARLGEALPHDQAVSDELAAEIERARRRLFAPNASGDALGGRNLSGDLLTWSGILEAHAGASGGSGA